MISKGLRSETFGSEHLNAKTQVAENAGEEQSNKVIKCYAVIQKEGSNVLSETHHNSRGRRKVAASVWSSLSF